VLDIPVVPPSMLSPPVPVAPPLPKAPPAAGTPPLPFELPDTLFEQLPRLASPSASAKQPATERRKVGRWLLMGLSNATHAISSSYLPQIIGTPLASRTEALGPLPIKISRKWLSLARDGKQGRVFNGRLQAIELEDQLFETRARGRKIACVA
jgi:hypothetical protein